MKVYPLQFENKTKQAQVLLENFHLWENIYLAP